jgi:uncharacterized Ntn-hydrolase superfamily protein
MLELLEGGLPAQETLATVTRETEWSMYRQLAAVDANGKVAQHTGSASLGIHGSSEGPDVVAIGNLLHSAEVPPAMVACFLAGESDSPLAERMLAALERGLAAGGERGPVHSAGLLVVSDLPWPSVNLRVDWSEHPIKELRALWERWRPEASDFVARALTPEQAPPFREVSE